jgi:HNH endonuclease
MIEIWKPVPSKAGILASSLGRVKLPEGEAKTPYGGIRKYKTMPTYGTKNKASKTARHEFMGISNRKFGNMKIHRLVCEAFHGPAPFDRAVVIHIDENALNNRSDNLRWGTQKENLNMPKFIEYCKSRTGENSPVIKGLKAKAI